jgi:transcriptional regulator GlxA family with amidase domain
MRIDIITFDGVDEMDALGPLEVLRSAQSLGADFTVRLVTRAPQREVRGAHGLVFQPDGVVGEAEVLVVTGGGWIARAKTGAWAEYQRGDMLSFLRDAATGTPLMAGVCTGTMLLAHAGIVGCRPATTHHAAHAELAATGARVVDQRVVDDGDLVTCGGVTSGIDLALWLVHRLDTPERAVAVAARMEYPWQPPSATA